MRNQGWLSYPEVTEAAVTHELRTISVTFRMGRITHVANARTRCDHTCRKQSG